MLVKWFITHTQHYKLKENVTCLHRRMLTNLNKTKWLG